MIVFISVLIGLASMIAYSLANVSSQPLVRKLGSAQAIFYRGMTICLVLAVACIPEYQGLDNLPQAAFALLLGIAGYVPVLAFMQGLKVSRVGIVAPIGATSALVTVVLAFAFLNTPLTVVQWLAVLLVIAANIAISVNPKDLRGSNLMQLESGVLYALIAAVGWGLFYFGLVYPTRSIGPWLSALFVELGVSIGAGLHLLATKQRIELKQSLSWPMVGGGLCIVAGTVTYTVGVHSYNVGIVAALSNSTALTSTLLAAYFSKEKLSKFEKVVAALMVIGVALVSVP